MRAILLLPFFFVVFVGLSSLPMVHASPDTLTIRPSGDDVVEWSISPATPPTHYDKVDDVTSDEDATYIQTNVEPERDLFTLGDTSQTGTINSVTVWARAKTLGNEKIKMVFKTYGTEYATGTSITLTTSYADYSETRSLNPYTSNAWTWTEVNALIAGVQHDNIGGAGYNSVTMVWVVVDYTPSAVEYFRTSSFGVTISLATTKLGDFLRIASYPINVALSFSRIGEFLRTVSYTLNVALNMIGTAVFERTSSFAITLSLVVGKFGEFKRDSTYSVDIAQSTSALSEFLRSAGYDVVVSLSALGLGEYLRQSSYSFSVAFSGAGVASFDRSASYAVNVGLTTSKLCEFSRSGAYTLSVAYSTSKSGEFYRAPSYAVTISSALSKLGEYLRDSSYIIGVALSGIGVPSFERSASFTVAITYQTSKTTEFSRFSSFTVTISYGISRLCEFSRQISYAVNIALSSIAEKAGFYERSVSYHITLSTGSGKLGEFLRSSSYAVSIFFSGIGEKWVGFYERFVSFQITIDLKIEIPSLPPPLPPPPPVVIPKVYLLKIQVLDLFNMKAPALNVVVRDSFDRVVANETTDAEGKIRTLSLKAGTYAVDIYYQGKLQLSTSVTVKSDRVFQIQIGIPVVISFTHLFLAFISIMAGIGLIIWKKRR